MRIGFDAKRAFANYTGLGSYSRTLIQSLYRQYPEHYYYLYTPGIKPNLNFIKEAENLFIRRPSGFFVKRLKSFWRTASLSGYLKKDGLDIYHGLSHELPLGIRKSGIKSVVTIHDLIYLRFPEQYKFLDRKIYDLKFRHACKEADKIIAISEQTKKDIVDFFGIEPKKIEVIYQSCDPVFFQQKTQEALEEMKQRYELPVDFVLYVGTVTPRKNLLTLLKALHLLQAKADVPLVMVGAGKDYQRKAERYISENNLINRVQFVGEVPLQDLPAFYQLAAVFVYPSLFEGFGIPIIESLYSKTPVITSTGSCFAEAGGPSSIYVDPLNAEELSKKILRVLEDSNLRERMIREGYHFVQKFTPEKHAQAMMDLYFSLKNK